MEHISLAQFEDYFDEIIARVVDDKIHYTITTDDGLSVVLVPVEAYDVLEETYNCSLLEDQVNVDLSGPYTQDGV